MRYDENGYEVPECWWCNVEILDDDIYFDFGDRVVCERCIHKEAKKMYLPEWRHYNCFP